MNKTTKDMYLHYVNTKLGTRYKTLRTIKKAIPDTELSNLEYYFIVENFFERVADKIVQGSTYLIPEVGYIFIEKKPKIVGTNKIDWKKSQEYKRELESKNIPLWNKETQSGTKWWFYLEDDYYLRWNMRRLSLASIYKFKPTNNNPNTGRVDKNGNKIGMKLGTKGKLVKANQENPNLHLIYISKLNNIK